MEPIHEDCEEDGNYEQDVLMNQVKQVDYSPMQIEVQESSAFGPSFAKRQGKCAMVLIILTIIMSLAVVGYLMTDTDQNFDIIGMDFESKESGMIGDDYYDDDGKEAFKKYSVNISDGIMFKTIGHEPLYHDKRHFTQGLTYSKHSDILFESNGLFGQSSVCRLNPNTGEALKCNQMEKRYFAEGMQVYGGKGNEKLIQLTWKAKVGFIYDANTLDTIRNFTFTTTRNEGWGICYDEKNHEFYVSDGSEHLHVWDADSLEEKRRVAITRMNGDSARKLNELEFVDGMVLANVWYEDVLLMINPQSGECESEYDMSMLWTLQERKIHHADVLNGISVSKEKGVLYITGKKWDRMFKLRLNGF